MTVVLVHCQSHYFFVKAYWSGFWLDGSCNSVWREPDEPVKKARLSPTVTQLLTKSRSTQRLTTVCYHNGLADMNMTIYDDDDGPFGLDVELREE